LLKRFRYLRTWAQDPSDGQPVHLETSHTEYGFGARTELPSLTFCADRDDEVAYGRAADVFQAVHLLGSGIGDPARPKILRHTIRYKLDATLANEHELGMEMLVCRVRHLAR
jgi:hypothetical protein